MTESMNEAGFNFEHCGNIALLGESVPVMESPMSMAILKAIRYVSSIRNWFRDGILLIKRVIGDKRVLSSSRSKHIMVETSS
ncbi:hypothetical protein [Archaeoglobus sulfaticallidus]|nr:hypothetical protein [Archaeoglobus sulfaticallidus]